MAASTRCRALYETALPIRGYLPRADVRLDLLRPSGTVTECPYKGTARHWSAAINDEVVPEVAWGYEDDVRREGGPVRSMIAFYDERIDLKV